MSVQMTVRLPDDVAEYIDRQVADGTASSRAAAVAKAVQQQRRKQAADRDIAILAALQAAGEVPYPDLAGLRDWASEQPLDID